MRQAYPESTQGELGETWREVLRVAAIVRCMQPTGKGRKCRKVCGWVTDQGEGRGALLRRPSIGLGSENGYVNSLWIPEDGEQRHAYTVLCQRHGSIPVEPSAIMEAVRSYRVLWRPQEILVQPAALR